MKKYWDRYNLTQHETEAMGYFETEDFEYIVEQMMLEEDKERAEETGGWYGDLYDDVASFYFFRENGDEIWIRPAVF